MNKSIKLLTLASAMMLASCADVGKTAGFGERFSDNFLLTSASAVKTADTRCISLAKTYSFKSGKVTFTLPAGKYKSMRKIDTGYFYYAPSAVTSDSWYVGSQEGVYLNNAMSAGNLFGRMGDGIDDRPVRSVELPGSVIAQFNKLGKCY